MAKQQQPEPQRRDTYDKTCTACQRVGHITKTNATTGNVYNEPCVPCGGRGSIQTPVGQ